MRCRVVAQEGGHGEETGSGFVRWGLTFLRQKLFNPVRTRSRPHGR